MDKRNDNVNGFIPDLIWIDEASEIRKKAWDKILDIVMDFRWYAREPAAWLHRYQKQCRFYAGDWKDNYNAKEKCKEEEKLLLGKDPIRDRKQPESEAAVSLAS